METQESIHTEFKEFEDLNYYPKTYALYSAIYRKPFIIEKRKSPIRSFQVIILLRTQTHSLAHLQNSKKDMGLKYNYA